MWFVHAAWPVRSWEHRAGHDLCTDCVPSRHGTAKRCVQGPALCGGRALARRRPTPSTPHAPWAPLRVSSTLLDARSPCTCPAASASAPRATPLSILPRVWFKQPGKCTVMLEVPSFHRGVTANQRYGVHQHAATRSCSDARLTARSAGQVIGEPGAGRAAPAVASGAPGVRGHGRRGRARTRPTKGSCR